MPGSRPFSGHWFTLARKTHRLGPPRLLGGNASKGTAVDANAAKSAAQAAGITSDARHARLLAELMEAGYQRAEPPILQPASVFLDLSGEDMRGRLYLTSDGEGAELCLRPEYTIPLARAYLASPEAGREAAFSYLGPVFRFRPGASGEFLQAGLESYGRTDQEAADAEILAVALEAVDAAGGSPLDIRIGDVALFARLIEALDLPAPWARRLRRGFAHGHALDTIAASAAKTAGIDHSGVLAALAGADQKGARALVEDLLSIAGISTVGGRSVGEIAERFLEQASVSSGAGLGAEQRTAIARFLAIEGDPDTASHELRSLAEDAGLDLGAVLDAFDARNGFLAVHGIDVSR
ncbi:MAG: ATP phosphoribosyltransferase regulatory subunit, partial [Methylobacteriaceae bacterium]|nr:ATP phosphoribosyltransferase regulatory subunit [Methylobacteriaceae bacterium]